MPTGKVKWFDAERGFGFATNEDGGPDVFVHASVLPNGQDTLNPGTKLEYGIADGKRGPQAMSVRIVENAPSVARNVSRQNRKPAEDVAANLEDLIKVLDSVSNVFRRGRYPDRSQAEKVASLLRAVAADIEA